MKKGIDSAVLCLLLATAIFAGSTLAAAAAECSTPSTICGYVFYDTNHNRAFDSGETGISNWTMFLVNFDQVQRKMVRTIVRTNDSGYYNFSNVAKGFYMLTEAEPNFCPDWVPITPMAQMGSFSPPSIRKDFGVYRLNPNNPIPDICNLRRI